MLISEVIEQLRRYGPAEKIRVFDDRSASLYEVHGVSTWDADLPHSTDNQLSVSTSRYDDDADPGTGVTVGWLNYALAAYDTSLPLHVVDEEVNLRDVARVGLIDPDADHGPKNPLYLVAQYA